jgi:6-phosphogluconolactonase (cycloisomerase 2 family)
MITKSLLLLIGAAVCSAVSPLGAATNQRQTGRVYVLSNKPANSVLVFDRAPDGTLTLIQEALTQGAGTGLTHDPLGSQGSLALRDDNKVLLAVNPASGELTAFTVTDTGLQFGSKVLSGGTFPVSVTVHDSFVYVVNQVGVANINGYTVDDSAQLVEIPGSERDLAGGTLAQPAQVSFTPQGNQLIVTEKGTRLLDIFNVLASGQTDGPMPERSGGITPFGFAFGPSHSLVVSEAEAERSTRGSASSYRLTFDNLAPPVSSRVPDTGTAACWVVITGHIAWVVNADSATISAYQIGSNGSITLVDRAAASIPNTLPIEATASSDERFLYQVLSTTGQISIFSINGSALTPLMTISGLPMSIQGIVAR